MENKVFESLQILGMKDNLWERVRGLGCMSWKGCHCIELLVD